MGLPQREMELQSWKELVRKSLQTHCPYDEFERRSRVFARRTPLPGLDLVAGWAAAFNQPRRTIPARLMLYLERLLQAGLIDDVAILFFVLQRLPDSLSSTSQFADKPLQNGNRDGDPVGDLNGSPNGDLNGNANRESNDEAAGKPTDIFHDNPNGLPGKPQSDAPSLEAAMLERIAHRMMNRRNPHARTPEDRLQCLRIAKPLTATLQAFSSLLGGEHPIQGHRLNIGTELGRYTVAYINDLSLRGILVAEQGKPPQLLRKWFGSVLPSFILLMTPAHPELAETLTAQIQQAGLQETAPPPPMDDRMVEDLSAITYQESVESLPAVTSRAALFIYLNAMLCGRPIADDTAFYTFVNTRYSSNVRALLVDLIVSAFDVLANAVNRTEPTPTINVYRSFLTNKLVILIESYAGMIFPPLTIESCITDALGRPDSSSDPFANQAFDLMSETRQEFLFACALHQLLPESSIETILGDVPMQSLPEGGKRHKADLIAQCAANSSRVEELIRNLENMDGNAGAVATALVEVLQHLCQAKDTTSLKSLCQALARRSQAMDVLLIFAEPRMILQPLCDLLNSWQMPDDQNEYHAIYEDFGSILLLILRFRHHFDLADDDLGTMADNTFLMKYLRNATSSNPPAEMSDASRENMRAWIKGLFETEGLSDELLATCGPNEFHLLIATVFDQSLKACQAGILTQETLKGGFEYLLESSLLPSLIAVLSWATRRLWETRSLAPQLDILLPLLLALVKPPNLSGDTASLHEVVLKITARSLERALAHVQRLHPRRRDVDPLLNALRPHIQSLRNAGVSHTELEIWCSAPNGGILAAFRHAFKNVIEWSAAHARRAEVLAAKSSLPNGANTQSDATLGAAPAVPSYTHRQFLLALQLVPAPVLLEALIQESIRLIHAGTALNIALDACTALLAAPVANMATATNTAALVSQLPSTTIHPGPHMLREALQDAATDAHVRAKTDPDCAAFLVHLHRRLEAQAPAHPAALIGPAAATAADVAVAASNMMIALPGSDPAAAAAVAAAAVNAGMDVSDPDVAAAVGVDVSVGMGLGVGVDVGVDLGAAVVGDLAALVPSVVSTGATSNVDTGAIAGLGTGSATAAPGMSVANAPADVQLAGSAAASMPGLDLGVPDMADVDLEDMLGGAFGGELMDPETAGDMFSL